MSVKQAPAKMRQLAERGRRQTEALNETIGALVAAGAECSLAVDGDEGQEVIHGATAVYSFAAELRLNL